MLLSLAMELARGSCHCKTCRSVLVLRIELVSRFLSLRRNVVTDAICLQAALVFGLLRYARNDKSQDRHTTFAMTILNLSLRAVQKARRGNLLAMTTCQQMATRLKAFRDDKLFFRDSRLLKFYRNPLRSVMSDCKQVCICRDSRLFKFYRNPLRSVMSDCKQVCICRDSRLFKFYRNPFRSVMSLRAVLKSRRGNLIASYLHFIASSTYF